MKDSIIRARVNVKSLAAEAKIIRKEMTKVKTYQKEMLYFHKLDKVRPEARIAQLALGYLRNKPRSVIEKTSKKVDVERLRRKLIIFTEQPVSLVDLTAWLNT